MMYGNCMCDDNCYSGSDCAVSCKSFTAFLDVPVPQLSQQLCWLLLQRPSSQPRVPPILPQRPLRLVKQHFQPLYVWLLPPPLLLRLPLVLWIPLLPLPPLLLAWKTLLQLLQLLPLVSMTLLQLLQLLPLVSMTPRLLLPRLLLAFHLPRSQQELQVQR